MSEEQGDGDGLIEVGEKIKVDVDIVDGQGAAVAGTEVKRMEIVANGPTENPNLIYVQTFSSSPPPSSLLGAGPSHSFVLPERMHYEEATELTPTTYGTARTPHYDTKFGSAGETLVWTVPAAGPSAVFATDDVSPHQNYIDVNNASAFSAGDLVVIDEGNSAREYVEVKAVEGNRLWFASPIGVNAVKPAMQHLASAEVAVVTPALESTYTLDEATGVITFTAAPSDAVVVSYTTDYVVPAIYQGTINHSPSLDPDSPRLESIGDWTGEPMVPGTYQIGVYGEIGFKVTVAGGSETQDTSYTEGGEGDTIAAFRLGSTGSIEPNERIESRASCYSCHRDLQFHGAHRRGYENCLLCHGNSGAEDWPQYNTANLNSPETPGISIEFRSMLHKIHHGKELAAGEDYVIAGFRGSPHTYEEVGFPSFVGGTANCSACHGANNDAWMAPTDRLHPDGSGTAPDLSWRLVCGSCHDDRTALGHMASNSSIGIESCTTCHGDGKDLSVETAHKNLVR